MRLLLIFFLSTILLGCVKRNEDSPPDNVDSVKVDIRNNASSEDTFMEFVALLPKVNLPFEIFCEKCCEHPTFDRENELIKRYLPEGANPIGLIFQNKSNVGVLATYAGDMLIPAVVIFDLTGKKTDEKSFMTGWCGRDSDYLGLQYFRINDDLTLNSTDTTYTLTLDKTTHEIIDTLKTEILSEDFYISTEGMIVQISDLQ